ncbi:hypothetical protein ACHAXS_000517, partial [Conticribra weissflogii]
MDTWAKKKRASESCGGLGMAKYVDSTETRRLSRLKNVRSSIGNAMAHNSWQKQQIEKRRREQLKQRKQEAKKKPIGDGIKIDTGVTPYEFTKCGLKLKLDKPAIGGKNPQRGSNAKSSTTTISQIKSTSSLPLRKSRYAPPSPMPKDISLDDAITPENKTDHDEVDLLDDGSIVCEKVRKIEIRDNHRAKIERRHRTANTSVRERLKKLSLNNNVNKEKVTAVPSSIVRNRGSKIQTNFRHNDEGKENEDRNSSNSNSIARQKGLRNKTVTKKHCTATTSIDALKKERAEAIAMLKEMERIEGERRRLRDSDSSGDSYSFDDNSRYGEDEQSRNSDYEHEEFGDENRSFFNSDDNNSVRLNSNGSTPTSVKGTRDGTLREKNDCVENVY